MSEFARGERRLQANTNKNARVRYLATWVSVAREKKQQRHVEKRNALRHEMLRHLSLAGEMAAQETLHVFFSQRCRLLASCCFLLRARPREPLPSLAGEMAQRSRRGNALSARNAFSHFSHAAFAPWRDRAEPAQLVSSLSALL
jgi:hypothetical protein